MATDQTVTRGSSWNFDITVSYQQGQTTTPPYTYTLVKDDLPQTGYTDISFTGNLATTSFSYTFNESVGLYVFGVYIKDSCGVGTQSNIDTSNITVIDCSVPTCGFTMTQII